MSPKVPTPWSVVGTTGESPTVDVEEHCALIETAVRRIAGRIPVIAGTGANSTREAIELAQICEEAGADAHLSVVPYYNKPTQEGLFLHFKSIAEAVELPLILYNVPGRTVADLANDTVLRLAQIPGVIGIKDATGNIERGFDLLKRAPAEFSIFSGDDPTAPALMLMGGKGSISVTANVAPRLMHQMCAAAIAGDARLTRELSAADRSASQPVHEANPIPAKWAVQQMGLVAGGLRLPMTRLSPEFHERVRTAMREAGIADLTWKLIR
jgi:4-hydroxy-tetrahydrodipicolinate synthase